MALPVLAVAMASYPVVAAIALAVVAGAVAGAALQRRYGRALDRAVPASERGAGGIRG